MCVCVLRQAGSHYALGSDRPTGCMPNMTLMSASVDGLNTCSTCRLSQTLLSGAAIGKSARRHGSACACFAGDAHHNDIIFLCALMHALCRLEGSKQGWQQPLLAICMSFCAPPCRVHATVCMPQANASPRKKGWQHHVMTKTRAFAFLRASRRVSASGSKKKGWQHHVMTKTRAFAILRASCRVSASGSGPSWQSGRLLFNQNLGSC